MRKRNKLVCGVGVNDADYIIIKYEVVNGKRKLVWKCPYYIKWESMLRRCYIEEELIKYPTYTGCTVCAEWLLFSNFKAWMEEQEWEGNQLDKDFLIEGCKVYSPDTCMFLPSKLNTFIVTCGKARGICPLGVHYQKKGKRMINERAKPYVSRVNNPTRERVNLGFYSTPEEAHHRYLEEKLKYCEEYIEEYKDEPLITKGLTRIKDKILFHIENNLELTSF